MAIWLSILEGWRGVPNMSCNGADLHHLVTQLRGLFESKTMFRRAPAPLTTAAKRLAQVAPLQAKEAKWGTHRDGLWRELVVSAMKGWTVAYTDGSAKKVRGWMQVGYGIWFGDAHSRNHRSHVPAHERQSVNRGELRGVLWALMARTSWEQSVIVLDSEYVFKGITQWSYKWRRHGWRNSSGEVGHRDLWEQILWLRESAGTMVQFWWVPLHLKVPRNDGTDELAMQGRLLHPNNLLPLSKRWEELGLVPMPELGELEVGLDADSGGLSGGKQEPHPIFDQAYSRDVSDTLVRQHLDYDSEGLSTDVSDSCRKRFRGGGGGELL